MKLEKTAKMRLIEKEHGDRSIEAVLQDYFSSELTDGQIAAALEISPATLYAWVTSLGAEIKRSRKLTFDRELVGV
jgi:hypothetical protein